MGIILKKSYKNMVCFKNKSIIIYLILLYLEQQKLCITLIEAVNKKLHYVICIQYFSFNRP